MTQVLCIGSVLWDVIGRSASHMRQGSDVPGRISRLPGGVALNIAMTLKRFGVEPVLLSSIGRDAEGAAIGDLAQRIVDTFFREGYTNTRRKPKSARKKGGRRRNNT